MAALVGRAGTKKKENTVKREKREKIRYNVLLVPDKSAETVRQFSISMLTVKIFMGGIILLIAAALLYCVALTRELNDAKSSMLLLQIQVEGLTKQKELLISQKVEQKEKIETLSDTLNEKVQQEEQREAEIAKTYVPSGNPVKGTASYDETESELEGNPIAKFHVAPDTSVTATANGMVSEVHGSGTAGYIVIIDHGNGYFSVYRNGTTPKVKEGADVTKETEIFHIEAGKEEFGYQIIQNDKYIEPLSLMEAYG